MNPMLIITRIIISRERIFIILKNFSFTIYDMQIKDDKSML